MLHRMSLRLRQSTYAWQQAVRQHNMKRITRTTIAATTTMNINNNTTI